MQRVVLQTIEGWSSIAKRLERRCRVLPRCVQGGCGSPIGYVAALAAVAVISVVIDFVQTLGSIDNASMLYVIGVLGVAVVFGRGPAVLVAVAAFVTFDWFFVQPLYTLRVASASEWFALLLLLATAVIAGQLTARLRQREIEARNRQREAGLLYDVVRLMSVSDLEVALRDVAERLLHELSLAAIRIRIQAGEMPPLESSAGDAEVLARMGSEPRVVTQMLGEGNCNSPWKRGQSIRWVRVIPSVSPSFRGPAISGELTIVPLRLGDRRLGDMVLTRSHQGRGFAEEDERLLSLVAAQLALAVERNRLRREATEAEALRRSDDLKTALLNSVSHDLRTPLSSIIAAAGALRQHDVQWTASDRQALLFEIEQEAQRLNRIVGSLLDLSRIEGGSLRPEKSLHDIGALVQEVVGRLKPITRERTVHVEIEGELPPVLLDYVEIDQVLSNLIENAARHTPPGTEITVSCRREGNNLLVEVADRGEGVAPDDLPHLFEAFYRGRRQSGSQFSSGLGLAVAKGLVEAHGGRIWAENRVEGGARFAFTLPLEPGVTTAWSAMEEST